MVFSHCYKTLGGLLLVFSPLLCYISRITTENICAMYTFISVLFVFLFLLFVYVGSLAFFSWLGDSFNDKDNNTDNNTDNDLI